MRLNTLIILLLISLLSCQTNGDKNNQTKSMKIDSSFHFTVKTETDFIDSKTGILTRSYFGGDKSVYFGFTNDEIQKIEALYFELKLDTLPNEYEPNCEINELPTFNEKYTISFNGKQKQFTYNYAFENCDFKTAEILPRIKKFMNLIDDVLNNKEKYRQLENSDLIFM